MGSVRRLPASTAIRGAANPPPLTGMVDQSARLEAKVEECAEELASLTAALEQASHAGCKPADANEILALSEQARHKIEQCAEELHSLNTALTLEMRERRKSERALAGMQVRLIGAQIDLLEAQAELTRAKEEREKTRYFAFHDALTGLANPNLFNDRLEHALAYAKRYQHGLAVMCIDVDRFKIINEAHSPDAGDKVLQLIAQRLHAAVRATDTVSRQEGDRFLFLLEELTDRVCAEPVARKLIRAVSLPLEVDGHSLSVSASVGVALYPHDAETAEMLINNADAAMYVAKRNAGGYAFFHPRHA